MKEKLFKDMHDRVNQLLGFSLKYFSNYWMDYYKTFMFPPRMTCWSSPDHHQLKSSPVLVKLMSFLSP